MYSPCRGPAELHASPLEHRHALRRGDIHKIIRRLGGGESQAILAIAARTGRRQFQGRRRLFLDTARCDQRSYLSPGTRIATDQPDPASVLRSKKTESLFLDRKPGIRPRSEQKRTHSDGPSSGARRKHTVHDYMDQVPFFLTDDGGPPRWFSPLLPAAPPQNAPLMLFLPGMDGTGLGLLLHHESLGPLFELRCLHIPVHDQTSFTGLLKLVEETVLEETKLRPLSPLFLVGDSFGGALALSVAARHPELDLVLILVNPATSFSKSQLQPLFPLLATLPSDLFTAVPYLLSFIMGSPLRMAEAKVEASSPPMQQAEQLRTSLMTLLPTLPTLVDVVPKDTLLWRLKMLQAAALDANARLHAVKAEVLILASGKDRMLPSASEANRLKKLIPGCRVRHFKESGHTLLLEGNFDLATVIKAAGCYRRSHEYDPVHDYVRPTKQESELYYNEKIKLLRQLTSPVFFSTSDDGAITQGLAHVPTDRPIMLVGYHMFMGIEIGPLIGEFLMERNILLRGLAHPILVGRHYEGDGQPDPSQGDGARLFGAVPVSGSSMFQLLRKGDSSVLYPGGAREALHRKGEAYKLFWPEKSEFVRMAARHGVTIIPFGVIGEDELFNILLDLDDLRKVPWLERMLTPKDIPQLRETAGGDLADQPMHLPIAVPKGVGRLYFLFQKPIRTEGREEELRDRRKADALYRHVKSEVEGGLQYLLEKRKEDPYRDFLPRLFYESSWGQQRQAPTFKP